MTSTIKTSNDKLVTKIKNFLKRQKSVIRHFNLTKQQEPKALAA